MASEQDHAQRCVLAHYLADQQEALASETRWDEQNLKRAFFLAAFAALKDPASRAYYDRKRAEGKRHNAALICLARRHCDVLYAMLRDGITYQPARPVTPIAA